MIDLNTVLKKKTELLCKGVYLDQKFIENYNSQGIEIEFGRKGGAGPLGGRYFYLEDEATFVNVALWDDKKKTNLELRDYDHGFFEVYDSRERGSFGKLKLIPYPEFYALETTEGIPMKKIALLHGIDCLASTVYQKCAYFACGEACKFCGIELSLAYDTTILEKNHQQISEVIAAAKKEGKIKHITLTSGTTDEPDKGVNRYITLVKGVKEKHPDIPIHVQIEPLENLSFIDNLKDAGADTIGIHIEVIDELLRSIITPGKSKIPFDEYERNWKHALDVFGKNQVNTYLLTGFGESRFDFIEDMDTIISLGVIPYITAVRGIPGKDSTTMPIMNHNALLEIYNNAAKKMVEYGINPFENKAGCVRCGGCSAINEAYRIMSR